jgi:hypothetical protein
MKKYKVYGPVQDGQFTCWQVLGPRNGFVAEFLTRKAALAFVKAHSGKAKIKIQPEFYEVK